MHEYTPSSNTDNTTLLSRIIKLRDSAKTIVPILYKEIKLLDFSTLPVKLHLSELHLLEPRFS